MRFVGANSGHMACCKGAHKQFGKNNQLKNQLTRFLLQLLSQNFLRRQDQNRGVSHSFAPPTILPLKNTYLGFSLRHDHGYNFKCLKARSQFQAQFPGTHKIYNQDWLVVWNIFYDFPYIGNNHPNWRTHIFQRGWLKPPTRYVITHMLHVWNI